MLLREIAEDRVEQRSVEHVVILATTYIHRAEWKTQIEPRLIKGFDKVTQEKQQFTVLLSVRNFVPETEINVRREGEVCRCWHVKTKVFNVLGGRTKYTDTRQSYNLQTHVYNLYSEGFGIPDES